jgi:hypothetical protein
MTNPLGAPQTGVSSATAAMHERVVTTPGTPLWFDTVRAGGPDGIRFDVWYCNRHLPGLANAAGVGRVRRYAAPAWSAYMALAEVGADFSPQSQQQNDGAAPSSLLNIERFVGRPLGTQRRRDCSEDVIMDSGIAYPVFFSVPNSREAEFNRWYNEEHLPMLLDCPQWVMCRRFRVTESPALQWTHVALHYLLDLRALQSPERDAARSTPWRQQLEAEGWFKPEYRVFYPLNAASPGAAK